MSKATKKGTALWVVGEPGLGKTTLVRKLLEPERSWGLYLNEKPKWTISGRVCAAGWYSNQKFDGADTVPYNGVDPAISYWAKHLEPKADLTIFDGDRFSHFGAVDRIALAVPRVAVAFLEAPGRVGRTRRLQRGSTQSLAWIKGRITKARRFYDGFPGDRLCLDATDSVEDLYETLLSFIGEGGSS